MKPGPIKVQDRKFQAADAGGNEALDGGVDPSLQALYRGIPRAGRSNLHRGGNTQGRVRRLSGRGRHQPAVSLQDPANGFRLFAGDGRDGEAAHAGRYWRSSDQWTSCSARSTGRPWQHSGAASEPASFGFDTESEAEIAQNSRKYPAGKQASAVHTALYMAQKQMRGKRAAAGCR